MDRRGFLHLVAGASAAGTAATVLPSAAADNAGQDRWKMRLSTSSIHFLQLSIEQACQRIAALAKARYNGCVNPFMHGDLKPDEMSRALAKSRDYLQQCYEKTPIARTLR